MNVLKKLFFLFSVILLLALTVIGCSKSGSDIEQKNPFCEITDVASVKENLVSCTKPKAVSVTTIEELKSALSSVADCSTITLANAEYILSENIMVAGKKNIRIVGKNKLSTSSDIIPDPDISTTAVIKTGSNTISFNNVQGLLLKDIYFSATKATESLSITGAVSVTIENVIVARDPASNGKLDNFEEFALNGISLTNVRFLNVTNSIFSSVRDAAFFGTVIANANFSGNKFHNSTIGLELSVVCNVTIQEENQFFENTMGLVLYSIQEMIFDNIFNNSKIENAPSYFTTSNITISDNRFFNNNRPNTCSGGENLTVTSLTSSGTSTATLIFGNPMACQALVGTAALFIATENVLYKENKQINNLGSDLALVHGVALSLAATDINARNFRFYATKNRFTTSQSAWFDSDSLIGMKNDDAEMGADDSYDDYQDDYRPFESYAELIKFTIDRFDILDLGDMAKLNVIKSTIDDTDATGINRNTSKKTAINIFKNLATVSVPGVYLRETILDLVGNGTINYDTDAATGVDRLAVPNISVDGVDREALSKRNLNSHAICIDKSNTGGKAGATIESSGLFPSLVDLNVISFGLGIVANLSLGGSSKATTDVSMQYLDYLKKYFSGTGEYDFNFIPGADLEKIFQSLLDKTILKPTLLYLHGGKYSSNGNLFPIPVGEPNLGIYDASSDGCTKEAEPLATGTTVTDDQIKEFLLK